MVPRGRGYLLNVSSVVSFQPAPHLAVYAATKAYVTSLTESLHEEARGTGVKVTALCPGLTRTEFQSVSNTEHYSTNYPEFAWLDAEDVARAGLDDVAKGRALSVPGVMYKSMAVATGMTRGSGAPAVGSDAAGLTRCVTSRTGAELEGSGQHALCAGSDRRQVVVRQRGDRSDHALDGLASRSLERCSPVRRSLPAGR